MTLLNMRLYLISTYICPRGLGYSCQVPLKGTRLAERVELPVGPGQDGLPVPRWRRQARIHRQTTFLRH
jgi:hypothetical protein